MLYISNGCMPSRAANSIQMAKMAQAFAAKLKTFKLVTSGDLSVSLKGMDSFFQDWYGLEERFKVVRLPLKFKQSYPLKEGYYLPQGYLKIAGIYACSKAPALIYSRNTLVVDFFLKLGFPVLWEWHEPIDANSAYCKFLKAENLVGVVTTLPQIAETFFSQGYDRAQLLIAPNAADINNILPHQTKESARSQLSLSTERKIILYSGSLYNYKGIPTILDVAKMMPEYEFVLVGGREEMVRKIEEKRIENVWLTGHVKQSKLSSYLYAADVLLLPTSQSWELANFTCPLKLFDYMASQRPIVASALPTIMTVVRDGENALLAEPDNPVAFRDAIARLLENPPLSQEIADRAFQEVQQLTWDNRAEQIIQFIQQRLNAMQFQPKTAMEYWKNYIQMAIDA
ncbi:glycosyltransferase family 4 protein [Lusitaniella coriacea]|uniref:glycosyltransferase family 4 protein n=1 Tax=Lusitaniella coriacea TaxID=1983105 RepID=UPI003CFAEFCB